MYFLRHQDTGQISRQQKKEERGGVGAETTGKKGCLWSLSAVGLESWGAGVHVRGTYTQGRWSSCLERLQYVVLVGVR